MIDTTNIRKIALKHYDNMIAWVEQQNLKDAPDLSKMWNEINDNWSGHNCVYCKSINELDLRCDDCVIYVINENDNKECAGGRYANICDATTWKEWLLAAKIMRQFIKENG